MLNINSVKKIQEAGIVNKTVLLRVDFNIPFVDGLATDITRILAVIPTIKFLLSRNCKIVLLSHFGRPNGQFDSNFSLSQIISTLNEHLPEEIAFSNYCRGSFAKEAINRLSFGNIILLENLRFFHEEEANNLVFAKELASLGDVYVNDAFSCCHRAHASISGITQYLPSYAGLALQSELSHLNNYLANPAKPMVAIVGGAKVSTKIELLLNLIDRVDYLVIAGAMAHNFLKLDGIQIGKSLYEESMMATASQILEKVKKSKCKLILPEDFVVAPSLDSKDLLTVDKTEIAANMMALDIGKQTIANIISILELCQTVVWNGPLGATEFQAFTEGTVKIASSISSLTASKKIVSVAGGGDTLAALSDFASQFSFVSTGGGAFLDLLQGTEIPGVQALYG